MAQSCIVLLFKVKSSLQYSTIERLSTPVTHVNDGTHRGHDLANYCGNLPGGVPEQTGEGER